MQMHSESDIKATEMTMDIRYQSTPYWPRQSSAIGYANAPQVS